MALRFRFGLPQFPVDEVRICAFCHKRRLDTTGDHSLTCMRTGWRNSVHNSFRDACATLARSALYHPAVEEPIFIAGRRSTGPGQKARSDISYTRDGWRSLIDVAVTHPLKDNTAMRWASAKGGGCASAYEKKKHTKYAPLLAELNAGSHSDTVRLIPVVVDSYGAYGDAARGWLEEVVLAVHKRVSTEILYSAEAREQFHCLSLLHARAVARLLIGNAGYRQDELAARLPPPSPPLGSPQPRVLSLSPTQESAPLALSPASSPTSHNSPMQARVGGG